MKIIDLLNKIANNEQPQAIKYCDIIYNFEEYKGDYGYVNKDYGKYKWFANEIDCDLSVCLNEEVEIIEEDKKIEKIKILNADDSDILSSLEIALDFRTLKKKINELIDKANSLEDK